MAQRYSGGRLQATTFPLRDSPISGTFSLVVAPSGAVGQRGQIFRKNSESVAGSFLSRYVAGKPELRIQSASFSEPSLHGTLFQAVGRISLRKTDTRYSHCGTVLHGYSVPLLFLLITTASTTKWYSACLRIIYISLFPHLLCEIPELPKMLHLSNRLLRS